MTRGVSFLLVCTLVGCAAPDGRRPPGPTAEASAGERIIRAQVYIEADYEAVWERFTTAPGYDVWASTPCLEFATEPGGAVLWGVDEPVYRGTLEWIEHGAGLSHTFQFVGFGFEEPASPVEVGIVRRGETVLVSIRHDCSAAPRTYEMISPVGWAKSLSRLKTLLETGTPMPWPTEPNP